MSDDRPPARLILIRHGESNVTVQRVIGGPRTCTGLSELGRTQAERLRDRFADTGEITDPVLYSSAYRRARETAEIVAPALGVEVRVDDALGEHDPGPDCDGMTFDAFVERYGMPDWTGDPHAVTFPGGETSAQFHHRVGSQLSSLIAAHPGRAIVAVCHGGVIDVAFRYVLGLPSTGGFELYTTNASITELLAKRPTGRLVRYNDSAHLTGLPTETSRRT